MSLKPRYALPIHNKNTRSSLSATQSLHTKRKRSQELNRDEHNDHQFESAEQDEPLALSDEEFGGSFLKGPQLDDRSFGFKNLLRKNHRRRVDRKDTVAELSNINPSITLPNTTYITNGQSEELHVGLRKQHLSVIMTILHHCLLNGDYRRASRAWSLMLRSETEWQGIDLRADGLWGIGAEVLLRRNQSQATSRSETSDTTSIQEDMQGSGRGSGQWLTKEGFWKAKEYFERLILQFPYNKHRPNAISSLDFYPALFGLWIYHIQEEFLASKKFARSDHQYDMNSVNFHMEGRFPYTSSESKNEAILAVRTAFKESENMASKLRELMISPPYSDNIQLLTFCGMLHLWISDLIAQGGHPIGSQMQIVMGNSEQETAGKYFRRAMKEGAVLPPCYTKYAPPEVFQESQLHHDYLS